MKIEQQTLYIAKDGMKFTDKSKCKKYETLIKEIAIINKLLPQAIDSSCKFANGDGYVQHTAQSVAAFKAEFFKLVRKAYPKDELLEKAMDPAAHISWLLRYLSDYGTPLNHLGHRLYCIDRLNREWGQPYYANDGFEKGKMVVWEKTK